MGIVDLKKLGLISGKIGPYVAYVSKDGKQILRKHVIPKDPKTPKQLAYRMRFGMVNKSLSPLNRVIKKGFLNTDNAYRKAVSKALNNAVVGEYPEYKLDYSKIQVAEGKLQLPTFISVNVDSNTKLATVNWNPEPIFDTYPGREDDRVNIVCLNESTPEAVCFYNNAKRSKGTATIDLSSKMVINKLWSIKDLHFWFYLSTYDITQNSDSIYIKCTEK
jgi:hypothetical protein